MVSDDVAMQHAAFVELARSRNLAYPIETKEHFVAQMGKAEKPVEFRGVAYDPTFAASLIPEFFFPISSEQDLVHKAMELIMARGLLPVRRLP